MLRFRRELNQRACPAPYLSCLREVQGQTGIAGPINTNQAHPTAPDYWRSPGEFMSQTETMTEDFASLFAESHCHAGPRPKASVAKGIVMAIEKDVAIIDVGLKVEGRVPLKEFGAKAKDGTLKVGDEVEVFLDRIENAMGEAMLSRDKARREEAWVRLEKSFERQRSRRRRDLWPRQGRLHRGPWRRRCVPARFAGRHPPGA
jgi:hypothetical protein